MVKHIDGTTTDHGFVFALVSTTKTGTTTLQGWDDANNNDKNDNTNQACPASGTGVELCGTSSVTWDTPIPATVTLTPATSSAAAGKTQKVTAHVQDQHGNPMAPATSSCCAATVSFTVTKGPNASQDLDGDGSTPPGYIGFCQTGGDGSCSKSLTDMAKISGTDTIVAFSDQNG